MISDNVDNLLIQWKDERPDVEPDSLGIVVRILHLAKFLNERADSALAELDLTLWEYDVLSALRRQGSPFCLSATELATEARLSTGAMTNRIDRLQTKDLVTRIASKKDRRSIQIHLTTKGQQLMLDALSVRLEAAEHSLASLDMDERNTLTRLLRKTLAREQDVS